MARGSVVRAQAGKTSRPPGAAELEQIPVSAIPAVNVAAVPQRSPLRYPGGKTWLIPHVRAWLGRANPAPRLLVEPFAGGGIVEHQEPAPRHRRQGFPQLLVQLPQPRLDIRQIFPVARLVRGIDPRQFRGHGLDHGDDIVRV